jgi:hypothetical protein
LLVESGHMKLSSEQTTTNDVVGRTGTSESYHPRHRPTYLVGGMLVIALGLLWRSALLSLPAALSKYGGDALWSLMVFFGFGSLFPRLSTKATAALALIFSFVVETSQLYHSPWIDAIRSTRLGALVLGSVFNWPDFPAYVAGVLIGVALEFTFGRINSRRQDGLG